MKVTCMCHVLKQLHRRIQQLRWSNNTSRPFPSRGDPPPAPPAPNPEAGHCGGGDSTPLPTKRRNSSPAIAIARSTSGIASAKFTKKWIAEGGLILKPLFLFRFTDVCELHLLQFIESYFFDFHSSLAILAPQHYFLTLPYSPSRRTPKKKPHGSIPGGPGNGGGVLLLGRVSELHTEGSSSHILSINPGSVAVSSVCCRLPIRIPPSNASTEDEGRAFPV